MRDLTFHYNAKTINNAIALMAELNQAGIPALVLDTVVYIDLNNRPELKQLMFNLISAAREQAG